MIKTWNSRIDLVVEIMGRGGDDLLDACERFVNDLDFDALAVRLVDAAESLSEQEVAEAIAAAALDEFLQSEIDGERVYRFQESSRLSVTPRFRD